MDATIFGTQQHFNKMYSLRNSYVNGSFELRALHTYKRIGKVFDARRKDERMPGRLSRLVSYFMNNVNFFEGRVDLQRGMMLKFPPYGCLYCTHMPCDCNDATRPDPTNHKLHDEQKLWTIRQWQEHLFKVYGHWNMGKFDRAFGRLISEFGELCSLIAAGPDTPIRPVDNSHECELESADFFSWILTLAYIQKIDLEQEVVERYGNGCPGCAKLVCNCPLVFISADGDFYSTVGVPGKYEITRPSHS